MALLKFFITLVIFCYLEVSVEGGECCDGYYDRWGDWQSSQWCSDYCCYTSFSWGTYELECCDNSYRQAKSSKRGSSCAEWWSHNAWVPVLISIGCIGAITACCFGCFKLCSSNNNRTGAVVTHPQQPAVIMMTGQYPGAQQYPGTQPYPSSSFANQAAYPPGSTIQGAYPGGPPPYEGGFPQKPQ